MAEVREQAETLRDRAIDLLMDISPRDRLILAVMSAVAVVGIVGGSARWMYKTLDGLQRRLSDHEQMLTKVEALAAEQASASEKASQIEKKLREYKHTDLSAFLEQAAERTGIRDRLDAVREKSSSSDGVLDEHVYAVELNRLSLEELSNFLWEVETAGYPLKIRTFKVRARKRRDETKLYVNMDVSSYQVVDATDEASG